MSLAEDYGDRLISKFEGVIVAIIATVFSAVGEALSEATETSTASMEFTLAIIQSYPDILTFVSLTVVLISAGLPGLFGLILESLGLSLIFSGVPQLGLALLLLGVGSSSSAATSGLGHR